MFSKAHSSSFRYLEANAFKLC